MVENKDLWTTASDGEVYIRDMETNHIRNTLEMINRNMDNGKLYKYPVQYDTLFNELAKRGEDLDDELDAIYKPL